MSKAADLEKRVAELERRDHVLQKWRVGITKTVNNHADRLTLILSALSTLFHRGCI